MTGQRDRASELAALVGFGVSGIAAVGLMVLYWTGGQPQLEGILLAVSFGGLAYGLVVWGKRLMPAGPYVDDRHAQGSGPAERAAFEHDLERGGDMARRSVLLKGLGFAAGSLGLAALFPLRSLGPKPGSSLRHTPWRAGLRLVNESGSPVRASEVPVDGLVTAFPEGFVGSASGQAVLIRLDPSLAALQAGPPEWAPDGLLAFSKVCTHAGCPVGLYQRASHQLLCPCHQSSFDVLRRARPVFGPAAAPLPQLPLAVDADGFVVATGDFSAPVGPASW